MTRKSTARLAGFTFLFYIAVGIWVMISSSRVEAGATMTARLANIAQHAMAVRVNALLTLVTFACAVVLGVTLYALTRDEDRELAALAACCRLTEGILAAVATVRTLALVNLALAAAAGTDTSEAQTAGAVILKEQGSSGLIGALCFAIGSTLFSYLFLRARSIPVWLARLGVIASALLVVLLPAQILGIAPSWVSSSMWLPMLVFEVTVAIWLMVKGVAPPSTSAVAR